MLSRHQNLQLFAEVEATKSQPRKLHVLNFDPLENSFDTLRVFDILIKVERLTKSSAQPRGIPAVFLTALKVSGKMLPCEATLSGTHMTPGDTVRVIVTNKRLKKQIEGYTRYLDAVLCDDPDREQLDQLKENLRTMVMCELDVGRMICENIASTLARHFTERGAREMIGMLLDERDPALMIDPLQKRALMSSDNQALWKQLMKHSEEYRNRYINQHVLPRPNRVPGTSSPRPPVEEREIEVDRKDIVNSTFKAMMIDAPWGTEDNTGACLSGGIRVYFDHEDGQGPGIMREFLSLVVPKLMAPELGLFASCKRSPHLFYPSPAFCKINDESGLMCRMAGRLFGLALLHRIHLPVSLAPHVWHYLTCDESENETKLPCWIAPPLPDFKPTRSKNKPRTANAVENYHSDLGYLNVADPEMAGSLKQLIQLPDKDLAALEMVFVTDRVSMGKRTEVSIVPNGEKMALKASNRELFVAKKARWHLYNAVREQLDSLRMGLRDVLAVLATRPLRLPEVITPFHLCDYSLGKQCFDINEWQQNTRFKGYQSTDYTIAWFWRWLAKMKHRDRGKVFTFATSLRRLPPNGFKALPQKFTITKGDPDLLPSAHTCFYELVLPPVTSAQQLRKKCDIMLLDHNFEFT